MPTKTVVEGKRAASKTRPKKTLTLAEQAERKAGLARLEADMEEAGKGKSYTLAEAKKILGL